MSIIRVNKTKDYTVMSNRHLRDRSLTLKAKGLMSQMLALPEGWDYSIAGLAAINKESEAAIKTALKELKAAGYLVITKRTPDQTESGRFEYIYDLYEDPDQAPQSQETEKQATEKQEVEIQPLEFQPIENRRQLNKDKSNTKELNTEELNKDNTAEILNPYQQSLELFPIVQQNEFLQDTIAEFIQMRQKIKKPIPTTHALVLLINKAKQLADGDPEKMNQILQESIMNSWQGVFPLKDSSPKARPQKNKNPFADLMAQET